MDVLGTLHSTIKGLWRYEAVVDKWPHFTSLVLRPLQLIPRQSKVSLIYKVFFYNYLPVQIESLFSVFAKTNSFTTVFHFIFIFL